MRWPVFWGFHVEFRDRTVAVNEYFLEWHECYSHELCSPQVVSKPSNCMEIVVFGGSVPVTSHCVPPRNDSHHSIVGILGGRRNRRNVVSTWNRPAGGWMCERPLNTHRQRRCLCQTAFDISCWSMLFRFLIALSVQDVQYYVNNIYIYVTHTHTHIYIYIYIWRTYTQIYIYMCVCVWRLNRHKTSPTHHIILCYILLYYILHIILYCKAVKRGPGGVGDQRRHLPRTRANVPAGLWWCTWAHLSRSWWPP